MNHQKRCLVAAALGLLTLGVGIAQAQSRILPPAAPAARAYLCFEGTTASEVMNKANEAGARGWRMVAASSQARTTIWCFEQLSGARPQDNR